MARRRTEDAIRTHKELAQKKLGDYLESLIADGTSDAIGKADKLCYWLEDWTTFLKFEPNFVPNKLKRYKRGEIIKVHLGFNVGSEEGGLHYAVVLDKDNALNSPIITIVPLTSVKESTDLSKLGKGRVFLGDEIYRSLTRKCSSKLLELMAEQKDIENEMFNPETLLTYDTEEMNNRLKKVAVSLAYVRKIEAEQKKMNRGSIALTSQITAISKIRIYDPKTNHDVLSKIRLSDEGLNAIDKALHSLYFSAGIFQ